MQIPIILYIFIIISSQIGEYLDRNIIIYELTPTSEKINIVE